jgi:hypothetical protein
MQKTEILRLRIQRTNRNPKNKKMVSRLCQVAFVSLFLTQAVAVEVDIGLDGADEDNLGGISNEEVAAAECVDSMNECEFWAQHNECANNPGYMLVECMKSCNVCPDLTKPAQECKNEDERCPDWALGGECAKNPSYMLMNCAHACRTCHLLDADVRCRPMPGRTQAVRPGDINQTYARILSDFQHLEPEVLSSDPWVRLHH